MLLDEFLILNFKFSMRFFLFWPGFGNLAKAILEAQKAKHIYLTLNGFSFFLAQFMLGKFDHSFNLDQKKERKYRQFRVTD